MRPMLTSEQKSTCQKSLLTRQSKLIRRLQGSLSLDSSQTDAVGELSSYDNHPGDMGTEMYERERDIALNAHTESELAEINAALHALESGTYAICRVCSMEIPYERLLAVPTTDVCIEHAEAENFNGVTQFETVAYSPNINPDTYADRTENAFDGEDAWQAVSRYGSSDSAVDFFEDKDNYDEMYANSEENIGYVEDVERYASTGFEED